MVTYHRVYDQLSPVGLRPEWALSPTLDLWVRYDAFRSWSLNGIYTSLVHHRPATLSARSATGCVVHGSGFLPTTSPTGDDETRRVDGSVHDGISLPANGWQVTPLANRTLSSGCRWNEYLCTEETSRSKKSARDGQWDSIT